MAGRRTDSKERVAVKMMDLGGDNMHMFQAESKIHRLATGHPNVVSLLDAFLANVGWHSASTDVIVIHQSTGQGPSHLRVL